jgi:hypothetical protein
MPDLLSILDQGVQVAADAVCPESNVARARGSQR